MQTSGTHGLQTLPALCILSQYFSPLHARCFSQPLSLYCSVMPGFFTTLNLCLCCSLCQEYLYHPHLLAGLMQLEHCDPISSLPQLCLPLTYLQYILIPRPRQLSHIIALYQAVNASKTEVMFSVAL